MANESFNNFNNNVTAILYVKLTLSTKLYFLLKFPVLS